MPLDGLRAWIGEVERKLGMRTRVFLALAAIAIGVGGAAIYLAIDTRDTAVSEGDVRALQEEIEGNVGEGAGGSVDVTQLRSEVAQLKSEVQALKGKSGSNNGGGAGGAAAPQGEGGETDRARLRDLAQPEEE